MFHSIHPARRLPPWTRRAAGITGVVLLAWLTCPRPRVHSLGVLLLLASFSFVCTVAAAAALRIATVGAWLPAFFYLWWQRSPWMLIVFLAIAAAAIRLLRGSPVPDEPPAALPKALFVIDATPYWTRRLMTSLFAATCFLATFLFALYDRPATAVIAFLTGAIIILWHWTFPASPSSRRHIPAAAAILLLSLFTGFSGEGDSSTPQPPSRNAGQHKLDKDEDIHSGIILWPEEEDHTVLVPPLPSMPRNLFSRQQRDPLSVPFYGVYWLFQPPHKKPPDASVRMRGDPARKSFHANDGRLVMEARQNFGRLIEASCCRSIQLVIRNLDYFRKSIKLELILLNTAQQQSHSLGTFDVQSSVDWRQITRSPEPVRETIDYPVPSGTPAFDEIVIRFHLRPYRSRASSRIAIDRFVFVPR